MLKLLLIVLCLVMPASCQFDGGDQNIDANFGPDIPGPTPTPGPEPAPIKENLIYINSNAEYDAIPNKDQAVLYFFATWCGPCKQQAPIYKEVAYENKSVMFYKIDVDKCKSSATNKGVTSIPAIFVGGKKLNGYQEKSTLQGYVDKIK